MYVDHPPSPTGPHIPRTRFVKTAFGRALTPRQMARAAELVELERALLAQRWGSLKAGASIDRLKERYPVSYHMIGREVHEREELVSPADIAEAIELGI